MKDYDNKAFYNSAKWRRVSAAYMASKMYLCERCGRPAIICHHRKYLDGHNVSDPEISLSFDNLEALCLDCHNREHFHSSSTARFDNVGNVTGVAKGREEQQFEAEKAKIDQFLLDFASKTAPEAEI